MFSWCLSLFSFFPESPKFFLPLLVLFDGSCILTQSYQIRAFATLKNRNKYSQKWHCAASYPNSYIYVSMSNLYIPTIGLPILLQENMLPNCGNTDTWMWKLGLRPRSFFSGNKQIGFSLQCTRWVSMLFPFVSMVYFGRWFLGSKVIYDSKVLSFQFTLQIFFPIWVFW